jgi:hypothetical protein
MAMKIGDGKRLIWYERKPIIGEKRNVKSGNNVMAKSEK